MKSITIHNMDESLASMLSIVAQNNNLSINKTIKMLLGSALGIATSPKKIADYSTFCGVWSESEQLEFDQNCADNEVVDPKDWE